MNRADLPIGVLDSGLGGLAVVRALRRHLPGEAIVYLGDTARGPYADKSPATIQRFTLEAGAALVRHHPKLIVMTCSTATAHALGALQAAVSCPVIGLIEPGAQAAAEVAGPVGVIAPPSAIRSGAFEAAIRRLKPKAVIHTLACPLLGDLAEEGWLDDPITDAICRRYLNQIPFAVHTVLLGCTRYSALLPSLGRVRANTRWLDSAELTALAAEQLLRGGLGFRTESARGDLQVRLTDLTESGRLIGERFLGEPLPQVEQLGS
jgi:glutamate racemase